jgi:cobalt-zinc-cadmium efflux system membrane fusion protein
VSRLANNLTRAQKLAIAAIAVFTLTAGALILFTKGGPLAPKHAQEDGHDHGAKAGKPAAAAPGASAKPADTTIAFTEAQIQSAGITLAQAGPARIRQLLRLPGEIRYNEDRTAHVVPRVSGVVEAVHADLGQQVKKGQLLAVIASPMVSDQRSEFLSAQRRLSLAQSTYEREKKLWEQRITAEQDYLQARQGLQEAEIAVANTRQKLTALGAAFPGNQGGQLNRYELRAPFDGMVMEKHIALGEVVKEDAQVFTISDLSTVWAEVAVSARDLPQVRVGEKAKVIASAFEASAEGTITYVGSLIGEQTRTARGRVVLPNPQGAWRPGLFASIEINAGEAQVPIAVASEAVQTIENGPVVFVRTASGFTARRVKPGRSDGQVTEIVEGLQPGERYASAGSFTLKAQAGKGSAEHAH